MMEFIYNYIVLLVFIFFTSAESARKSSIVIGDNLYFADVTPTLRSHDQAERYCQSQDAELAKVTNRTIYDRLRVALPLTTTYWIDGIDKQNHERFAVNNNCNSGQLDFTEISPNNLDLPSRTCLALVKGSTAANSRIQAMDCIIPNRVLCSFPLNGCQAAMRSGDGD